MLEGKDIVFDEKRKKWERAREVNECTRMIANIREMEYIFIFLHVIEISHYMPSSTYMNKRMNCNW